MSMQEKKVVIVHTGPVTMEPLLKLLPEQVPGVEAVHITDTRLVRGDAEGMMASARKIAQYGGFAESLGASALFIACSAISQIAEMAMEDLAVPVVRIDERMAGKAVALGERIGLLMTSQGTVAASKRLIVQQADAADKSIELKARLCVEAAEAAARGDAEEHDRLLAVAAQELAPHVDVIVLAQASMARSAARMGQIDVPVLTSPVLGLEHLREVVCAGENPKSTSP